MILEQLNIHRSKNNNNNLDQSLIFYTKSNSKWITDLNIKHKTITLLEKKIGENLWDLRLDTEVLDLKSKA